MVGNNLSHEKLNNQLLAYSHSKFSGRLDIAGSTTWSLYFCLGRLVWATGGEHSLRRWQRLLRQFCPQIVPEEIRFRETNVSRGAWEYLALTVLVKRLKVEGEQAVAVIKNNLVEVLFDILQKAESEPLTFTSDSQDILDASLTLIKPTQAMEKAIKLWGIWRNNGLAKVSPNLAIAIKKPQELRQMVAPEVYQNLLKLGDGKKPLRELAIHLNKDLLTLMRLLIPFMRQQVIGFAKIADLQQPNLPQQTPQQIDAKTPDGVALQENSQLPRPLIAYVEDNVQECLIMGEIVTKANYGFLSISDSVHALPLLLQHKPDFIFLDLVMPVANGYEICTQIRRVSQFKATPVIMVTSSDGIIDRVRAKMVGANDFIAKPIVADKVLATLSKKLNLSEAPSNKPSFVYQPS